MTSPCFLIEQIEMKYIKQIIPFSKHNHKRKRDPAAKRHENMTDMHPINFSHKDMNVGNVATSTHTYIDY